MSYWPTPWGSEFLGSLPEPHFFFRVERNLLRAASNTEPRLYFPSAGGRAESNLRHWGRPSHSRLLWAQFKRATRLDSPPRRLLGVNGRLNTLGKQEWRRDGLAGGSWTTKIRNQNCHTAAARPSHFPQEVPNISVPASTHTNEVSERWTCFSDSSRVRNRDTPLFSFFFFLRNLLFWPPT